jgi:hypothetical protein
MHGILTLSISTTSICVFIMSLPLPCIYICTRDRYFPYRERLCAASYAASGIRVLSHHSDTINPIRAIVEAGGYVRIMMMSFN